MDGSPHSLTPMPPPTGLVVQFQPDTYSVTEGEQASLTAVLNFAAIRDVTVNISTSNGLATGENNIILSMQ